MAFIYKPTLFPQQEPNILAFDTSADRSSIALWAKGKMYSLTLPVGFGAQSPAACLIPQIQQLLETVSLSFQELDVIATPVGPGSFTGIRLGIATAQGLILATKAKCFAPTTFHVAAFGLWRGNPCPILVTLSTKRESFYTQAFDETLTPFMPARIQTEEEIQDFLNANSLMNRGREDSASMAESLIHLYFDMMKKGHEIPEMLRPYYLHDPEFAKRPRCLP
jgi:tRNA threonylcarbamoyladenosine biosynthesis protein TsaB